MEQPRTLPEAVEPVDEIRVKRFARYLGAVSTVEDLFDDGEGGIREPSTPPEPSMPPGKSSCRLYREYFAPVYDLSPPTLRKPTPRINTLV